MNYNFATKEEYVSFLSSLREGKIGEQSTIYYDDKNEKVIKIFTIADNPTIRNKEAKLKELIKYSKHFPNAALPEEIVKCNDKCCGYVMKMFKDCVSLKELPIKARNNTMDKAEILKIACNLAKLVKELHSQGIIIGDFHSNQFMTKDGEVYACDTDTWGIINKGHIYEADRVGRDKYIDPLERDFTAEDVIVKEYTQETDCFSLAVVIFEILVGFHPFNGTYQIVRGYDGPLKALNRISIIGNHDFKKMNIFRIEHVAWMSKELQKDFIKIFEGMKRFNILPSLVSTMKELEECKNGHYYNSKRYSKCPICKPTQDALEKFRTDNITSNISYEKNAIFPQNEVRKVIDKSTYFDFNKKVIFKKNDGDIGDIIEREIGNRMEEVYFIGNDITINLKRINKVKQWCYTFLGRFKSFYTNCSFSEKMRRYSNDSICNLEVYNKDGNILYSKIILQPVSRLKVKGDYLFYINEKGDLIKVHMTVDSCTESVVNAKRRPVIYEINRRGSYCFGSINKEGHLEIIINGRGKRTFKDQIPKLIRYDDLIGAWYIITKNKNSNKYECYVTKNMRRIIKEFELVSLNGLNLKNSIFYNGMLVIPENKRVIFLSSGKTLENTRVSEVDIGVVNRNSKISVSEIQNDDNFYLFVQNSTQVYKFKLGS